ncbi:hypothetical protein ACFQVC_30235 [Streptomyces monticola]|uniref:Uncharacterized protein n=1 Tax=Streptomyces monticola TaxID=2666263 RepID=A0ABW2JQR4_9ACTN
MTACATETATETGTGTAPRDDENDETESARQDEARETGEAHEAHEAHEVSGARDAREARDARDSHEAHEGAGEREALREVEAEARVTDAAPGAAPLRPRFTISADGSYAARLAPHGDSGDVWFPERWTLDGPEPYAVPLPVDQPEEPDADVLPMADGRVLIHRAAAGRQLFSLLYPTGPGTGELPLGAVECESLSLLPPSPDGSCAYAVAVGRHSSSVWLVAGGAFGPEHVAEVPGRCSGGVWLDRAGRLLALDQEWDGRTKTVAVDLERGGEVSPLLQIGEDSDDRLLLADPGSGLILVRSDAPGHDRLGWGVLGSTLPVRFPECLRLPDCAVTPFAIQPGQVLMPEHCAVALRIDGAAGTWLGLWRPMERQIQHLAAPEGWLAGAGLWTPDGILQLPYSTASVPCGVARVQAPAPVVREAPAEPAVAAAPRPVPLQQAPLTGRVAGLVAGRGAGPVAGRGAGPVAGRGAGPVAGRGAGPVAGRGAGPVAGGSEGTRGGG